MRFFSYLAVFSSLCLLSACTMFNHDDRQPYYDDPKTPHNVQWRHDDWTPQDWIDAKGSAKRVIDDLYASGIITDQYVDDDVPVLEVGDAFMDLSTREKRRVTDFVDHVFQITTNAPDGAFIVMHRDVDEPLGLYTKHGLQIQ